MTIDIEGDDANITSGFYMPGSLTTASVTNAEGEAWVGQAYTAFATAVQTALNASPSGPGYTVTWSSTTGLYTIAKAGTFVIVFQNSPEYDNAADALGFARNTTYSGANTYTSVKSPVYQMISAINGRTNVVGPVEPDDIAEESVSDGGEDYVITRKVTEQLISWAQQMEPRNAVMAKAASASSLPYSWQQWFRHTRGTHPFWCSDVLEGEPAGVFYRLTAKGAALKPRRFTPDYDDQWVVPFDARWLGTYNP